MAVTNNLKVQVDTPVWEWCRFAPAASTALSATCAADNSTFHLQHGRYIYYLIAATNFSRYDTITDSYMQLASPQVAPATPFTSMSFAGGQGYYSRVIAAPSTTTIQAALLTGQVFKGFDIRIIGGTGAGQQRLVTAVADPVIVESGTATGGSVSTVIDTNKYWQINQWVGYQVKIVLSTGAIQTRKIMYNNATQLTLADSTKMPEDVWSNGPVFVSGPMAAPAAGTVYQIESSVLTVDSAFSPALDATSRFVIQTGGIWMVSYQATSLYSMQYYDVAADQWYIRTAGSGPITLTPTDGTIQRFGENASIWDRGYANGTNSTTTLQDTTKAWTVNQYVGYWVRIMSGTGVGQLCQVSANTATTLTWVTVGTAPDATSRYSVEGFEAGTASSSVACSATASSTAASISGNVMTVGSTVTSTFKPGMILSAASGMPGYLILTGATGASAQAIVTVSSTTGIYVGMVVNYITGTTGAFTAVSTVISVNSATTFTVSQNIATTLAAATIILSAGTIYASAGGATSSGSTITVTSMVNVAVGMIVGVTAGVGAFTAGTTVTAVTSLTTFTVSQSPSTPLSGGASVVTGYWPFTSYIVNQLTGSAGVEGTYTVFPPQLVSSTTITGTGIAALVDSSKSWTANRWTNLMVRITGGTGAGQVRSIVGNSATTLYVSRDWMIALDSTSTYVIHGDTDKLLLSIGSASPGTAALLVQNQDADILTLGRGLEYGSARGFSAQLLNLGQSYGDTPAIACSGAAYTASSGSVATTAGSVSGSLVTVTFSTTVFPVGSFVTVAGCTPSAYNGTYRVLASFAGSCTYKPSSVPGGAISGQGTIAVAASLLVTTVNPHNFITGQVVGLRGDISTGAAVNNAAAGYELFANTATTFTVGLPSASAAVIVQAQSTQRLTDASKNWVVNQWAGCLCTYNTAAVTQASGVAAETAMQIIGNDTNTLYFIAAAASAPVQAQARYVITPPAFGTLKHVVGSMDAGVSVQSAGTANSTSLLVDMTKYWTGTCNSSGTTLITSTTTLTAGLQVGMYLGISSGTGTFTPGAGTTYTSVQVTAINSSTTFTVSAVPATNLASAVVIATLWRPGVFVNRKLRIIGGTGLNQELVITANTANSLSFAVSTQPITGQSSYAILQAPGKGTGIGMNWNFGQSDTTRRGSYVYLPRGNAVIGIDRLNMMNDQWDLFQNSPGFETLTTGSMYAYDGVDRIYFTKDIAATVHRVYYYDINKNIIHPAGIPPYIQGTAITGNRMEIYETTDGLKFLWINRQSGAECFKTLIFW